MGFQIRQTRPATLREAIEAAQNYEDSAQSLRNASRRNDWKTKRHAKRGSHWRKYSDSSSSSSESNPPVSESDSSESDSGIASGSQHRHNHLHKSLREEKGKTVVKVKIEKDNSKKIMKNIQESLEAIKVNLAENRIPRRITPTMQANVWCPKCQTTGHFPSECMKPQLKKVHYVNPDGEVYIALEEEEEEEDMNPIFQIQPTYGR